MSSPSGLGARARLDALSLSWGRWLASRPTASICVAIFVAACLLRAVCEPFRRALGWAALSLAGVFVFVPMFAFAYGARALQWCLGNARLDRQRYRVGVWSSRALDSFEEMMDWGATAVEAVKWRLRGQAPLSWIFAAEAAMCMAFAERPGAAPQGAAMEALGCNPYAMSALTRARSLRGGADADLAWHQGRWPLVERDELGSWCSRRVGLYGWLRGLGRPGRVPRDDFEGAHVPWMQRMDARAQAAQIQEAIGDGAHGVGPGSKPRL